MNNALQGFNAFQRGPLSAYSDINHHLIEAVHDGVLLLSMEQKVLYASPHYLQLLGYDAAELQAQEAMRRVVPEDRQALGAAFQRTVAEPGSLQEAHYRARAKDGRLIHFHARGRSHPQGIQGLYDGPCVLVSVRDVSAEVQAQAELERRTAFHRAVAESIRDGILVIGMDRKAIYVSPSYAALLGMQPEEIMGKGPGERIHPEDLPLIQATFQAASAGEAPPPVRYRVKTRQGYAVHSGYARLLPDGIPGHPEPCVLVITSDRSDEVAAEERLAKSERFYRGVLERFDDVVGLLDAQARFTYISPSVERMLGYPPERLIGSNGFDLLLPEDRPVMRDTFQRSLHTPSVGRESEFRVRDASGKVRILAAVSSPAGPELGSSLLFRLRDVTRARLTDEELMRSERLTLLSELLAGVSHELRNPLLAVSANAELLAASAALNDEDRESAESIQQQVRRLRQLLEQALNPDPDPRPEPLEPQTLLEQALQQARRRFGPLAGKVRCEVQVRPPCGSILALPGRLQLALANVVLNALQAAPDEGAQVTLSAACDNGGVLLSIVDNGPGAPNDSMSEIFDPFFTTRPTASGLGLSTAKRIVEAHQGRLWAAPAQPHGLAVHAWLPAVRPESI